MPFELSTPDAIMLTRLFGVFTALELNRLATACEIAEALSPIALDRITDLSEVQRFEVGFPEIYYFAIRRSEQRFTRVVKSAIVVKDPVQFGYARMYETLNVNPQISVRILRSVSDAKAWFADLSDLVDDAGTSLPDTEQ